MLTPSTIIGLALISGCPALMMMNSSKPNSGGDDPRPRIRDLGIAPGILPTGALNAITDVDGVRVGHETLLRGDTVRTGVTAILPHGGNLYQDKVRAAVHVGNGFGKAAGFLQVQELGVIESPIILTNTLNVAEGIAGGVEWTLAQPGNEGVRSVNVVVGETNDGVLNDIRGRHVTKEHVIDAINAAKAGAVEEGAVGAGAGTICFGWKGGIGTASRRLPESLGGWTVGVLVQSNFGGVLTIDGRRIGEALGQYSFRSHLQRDRDAQDDADSAGDGSCMIIIATDAPLTARQLERIARRGPLGLARTGSFMSNGSGDFIIAFSTANRIAHHSPIDTEEIEHLRDDAMSPLFLATVEAVEEAIYNSLMKATTTTGNGRTIEAIPIDRLKPLLSEE